jgi:hypothetical protein
MDQPKAEIWQGVVDANNVIIQIMLVPARE